MKDRTEVFGEYRFGLIDVLDPERDAKGAVATYRPQTRYKNKKGLPLHRYGKGAFCRLRLRTNFNDGGVYVITVGTAVMYVGECEDLAWRFNGGYGNISPRACYQSGQTTNCKVNKAILASAKVGKTVKLWFLKTGKRKRIEKLLRSRLSPTWNA